MRPTAAPGIMRNTIVVLFVALLMLARVSADDDVAPDEILRELMPTIDEATKSLDSNVSQQKAEATAADAKALDEMLQKVEAYFVRRRDAADAVAFSQEARGVVQGIARAARSGDFDAASASISTLVRSCTSCHDAYRRE